jgi:Cys-tRNA synthase (O-phospho-L-seryl-tRNA:Cys-tRNA synthase)
VLHNDTSFLYFDSLSHFFSYLRRNRKKKEIVEFDGRGYLSFHVGSNEGYQGI